MMTVTMSTVLMETGRVRKKEKMIRDPQPLLDTEITSCWSVALIGMVE